MPSKNTDEKTAEEISPEMCGIVMPIAPWGEYTAQHWAEMKNIIERAIEQSGMIPQPVWIGSDTDIIQGRIVRNLFQSAMIVCDISGLNPNVMFELGMRLTFRKPVIVVSDDSTRLPFDTAVVDTLIYPADLRFSTIEKFITDLSARITAINASAKSGAYKPYLDIFGTFQIVEPPADHVPFANHLSDQLEQIQTSITRLENESANRRLAEKEASAMLSDLALGRRVQAEKDDVLKMLGLGEQRGPTSTSSSVGRWTPAREAILKDMWESGRSASQISEELGISRNVVIAKAHRLGLSRQTERR